MSRDFGSPTSLHVDIELEDSSSSMRSNRNKKGGDADEHPLHIQEFKRGREGDDCEEGDSLLSTSNINNNSSRNQSKMFSSSDSIPSDTFHSTGSNFAPIPKTPPNPLQKLFTNRKRTDSDCLLGSMILCMLILLMVSLIINIVLATHRAHPEVIQTSNELEVKQLQAALNESTTLRKQDAKELTSSLENAESTMLNYRDAPVPRISVVWDLPCECSKLVMEAVNIVYPLWRKGLDIRFSSLESKCFCTLPEHLSGMLSEMRAAPLIETMDAEVVITHSSAWDLRQIPPESIGDIIRRVNNDFETIPASTFVNLTSQDLLEIWVPSEFHVKSFTKAGIPVNKLKILPPAIDTHLFSPTFARNRYHRISEEPEWIKNLSYSEYNFLSGFKFESRKNWKTLVQAYTEEFANTTNVTLWIKTENPLAKTEIEDFIKNDLAHITVKPRLEVLELDLDTLDMPLFYAGMDCFVLPSHLEGWSYSVVEAMSMELPVIVTAYGGMTEFGPETNVINETEQVPLLNNGTVQGAFDGGWGIRVLGFTTVYDDDLKMINTEKGTWAIPDIKHLKQLMRYVFTHPEEGKKRGRAGRRRIVQKFSQEATTASYLKTLFKRQKE